MRELEIQWRETRAFASDLSSSGARFLVTGSTGLRFYVPNWPAPGDLDLVLEPSEEMLRELNAALLRAGAPRTGATVERFLQGNAMFRSKPPLSMLNVDFLVPTQAEFSSVWSNCGPPVPLAATEARLSVASISTLEEGYRLLALREPTRADRAVKALRALAQVKAYP